MSVVSPLLSLRSRFSGKSCLFVGVLKDCALKPWVSGFVPSRPIQYSSHVQCNHTTYSISHSVSNK